MWTVPGIKFDVTGGVNEVLVNTEKGKALFAQLTMKRLHISPFPKRPDGSHIWSIPQKHPVTGMHSGTEYNASAALADQRSGTSQIYEGFHPYPDHPQGKPHSCRKPDCTALRENCTRTVFVKEIALEFLFKG